MKPVVAIIGRINVGKSTLFNRIVGRNKAAIDDLPGLTRDRNYAEVCWEGKDFILIDTGGFEPLRSENIATQIREQTQLAIEEADSIIFLADGRAGLNPSDSEIVRMLQFAEKPIFYVINKIDGPKQRKDMVEFYQLGVDPLIPISAKHKLGISELMSEVTDRFPSSIQEDTKNSHVKIAIVGRPNVGKSSLINTILGSKRFLTDESPGTTRDSIDTSFTLNDQKYLLIDTAGIRRKSRVSLRFEKYCIIEALKSLDRCDIAIILIDVTEGVTQQDAKIARFIHEKGRACIIAVNKWDLISKDNTTHNSNLEKIRSELRFLEFAPVIFVSALTGQRVSNILKIAPRIYKHYRRRIQTHQLNIVLNHAIQHHPPPHIKNKALKFYYATQIAESPPHFVIFTNYPQAVPLSYKRFLINQIREHFEFEGTPIRLSFKPRKRKDI
jgi:GTP-binding protein